MNRFAFALALAAAPMFAAAAAPVVVQGAPITPERTIVMVGQGQVKAMPDTATISGGVVTRSRRAADALRDNNEAMAKAIAALKAIGLLEKQITTASVRFEPQYAIDRNGNIDPERRITGYTVTNQIIVELTDKIERAGQVFDTLIQNGANDAASVNFRIKDLESVENQARAEAAKNALAHARVFANALGAELGPIKAVHEGDSITAEDIGRLPDRNLSEALQRVPGVVVGARIEASEQTVTRVVTVIWALK